MDLHFNGTVGRMPWPSMDNLEYLMLAACSDERFWPCLRGHTVEELAAAIDSLRALGWGFEWITRH